MRRVCGNDLRRIGSHGTEDAKRWKLHLGGLQDASSLSCRSISHLWGHPHQLPQIMVSASYLCPSWTVLLVAFYLGRSPTDTFRVTSCRYQVLRYLNFSERRLDRPFRAQYQFLSRTQGDARTTRYALG